MRNKPLLQVGCSSMPVIRIADCDHKGGRILYLVHDHDGRDLDLSQAEKTLEHLRYLGV
ncbi:MAG: hypothetical protein R3D03_14130 [Geminicoccaceae bacterium]